MKPSDVIDLRLMWMDPANIIHMVTQDVLRYADNQPGWTTVCGVVLEATPMREIELGHSRHLLPNCMGCMAGTTDLPHCLRCNDKGYMDNGWADFPCACPAGDKARFEIQETISTSDGGAAVHTTSVTGEYLKQQMAKWRRA